MSGSGYAFSDPNAAAAFGPSDADQVAAKDQQNRQILENFIQDRGMRSYLQSVAQGDRRARAPVPATSEK